MSDKWHKVADVQVDLQPVPNDRLEPKERVSSTDGQKLQQKDRVQIGFHVNTRELIAFLLGIGVGVAVAAVVR